jgi:uridine phosphorylase
MDNKLNFKTGENEGIIRPLKGKGEPRVSPDVLMVTIPSELKYLVSLCGAKEIPSTMMNMFHLYRIEDGSKAPLTISGPFFGAPQAVVALEKLIVLGAERIWVLGWCGSLQPTLRIGHLIIPTAAISEEGTSSHYPVGDKALESDSKLNRILEKELIGHALPFTKGPIWTTDALYRETPNKVIEYQAQGILAVEMEISALMAVTRYRSIALAALLVVSDELFDLKWRPGFSDPFMRKTSRFAAEILLNIAGSLTRDSKTRLFLHEDS